MQYITEQINETIEKLCTINNCSKIDCIKCLIHFAGHRNLKSGKTFLNLHMMLPTKCKCYINTRQLSNTIYYNKDKDGSISKLEREV